MADRTSPKPPSLWRNRDYLNWWTGTAFSVLGSNVSVVAFPLLLVLGTGSFAVCNLFARSLAVLNTPLAQVQEVEVS